MCTYIICPTVLTVYSVLTCIVCHAHCLYTGDAVSIIKTSAHACYILYTQCLCVCVCVCRRRSCNPSRAPSTSSTSLTLCMTWMDSHESFFEMVAFFAMRNGNLPQHITHPLYKTGWATPQLLLWKGLAPVCFRQTTCPGVTPSYTITVRQCNAAR